MAYEPLPRVGDASITGQSAASLDRLGPAAEIDGSCSDLRIGVTQRALRVSRRDPLGGLIHEYELAATA
jgi:hypothetical protein